MKKISLYIICLFFVIISFKTNVLASVDEDNIYHNIEENIYIENSNIISFYNTEIYQEENKFYLKEFDIYKEGTIIGYYKKENYIYIIFNKNDSTYLEMYNNQLEIIDSIKVNTLANDSIIYNNLIYIIGSRNNDASISTFTVDLEYISTYDYGGEGYEEFIGIGLINEQIYLYGLKDGISHNSCFANSGNNEDIKSFIISIDDNFQIDKSLYLNKNTKYETIDNIIINNNNIYFLLNCTDNSFYHYTLSSDLEIIESFNIQEYIDVKNIYLLDSYNLINNKVYIYVNNENLYYSVFDNKILYTYKITEFDERSEILNIYNNEGVVEIYYKSNMDIHCIMLTEYHIVYNNEKVITYKDNSYLDTSHFKVDSFFEELKFTYDQTLNESINLNISGEYDAYYVADTSHDDIIIKTKYKVLTHLNIVNEGIYKKGYQLEFLDKLYVNNEKAYPGQLLDKPGEYSIKHETKEKINEFKIYVVDDYYKEFDINYKYSELMLNKGSIYNVEIHLSEFKKVKEVIVNNNAYPFIQNDKKITLQLNLNESNIIKDYNIDYLVFEDDSVCNINEKVNIKVLKQKPIIDIYYDERIIDYQIKDIDKTINDVLIKYYNSHELIKIEKTYLKNQTVFIDHNCTKIEIILQYEDGTSNIYEEVLYLVEVNTKSKKEELLFIDFLFNDESINGIKIENKDSLNLDFNTTSINNIELELFPKKNNSLKVILICVLSTVVIILSSVGIFLYKKIRGGNKNEKSINY